MPRLSKENLPKNVDHFTYDRDRVTAGIVHFGVGNFHRAHQAVYCDDLLEKGETRWGIMGVSLRSSAMQEALAPQDYLYTLATLGGETHYRIIGSLKGLMVAPQDPQAVINAIAEPTTQIVSSTITEKGYCLTSGKVDFTHPDLNAELSSLELPRTIYGYLARALIMRSQSKKQSSKLTIMCCDNISAGGEILQEGVHHLLHCHNGQALRWTRENVTFISSMVDRVCPSTSDELRESVSNKTKCLDAWPVSAEPFRQWVIENNFAGMKPDFDLVGAIFVDNIAPFEQMKLQYLNAAHSIIAAIGYLYGDEFVHEALQRTEVFDFVQKALQKNIAPNAAVPVGCDSEEYTEDVINRFQNQNLPYANLQVGTDSSQKIQQRWYPTIDEAMRKNSDNSCLAFCLAAWVVFIQRALANDDLKDPNKDKLIAVSTDDAALLVKSYLSIANAEKFTFFSKSDFLIAVTQYVENIYANGIEKTLIDFLSES